MSRFIACFLVGAIMACAQVVAVHSPTLNITPGTPVDSPGAGTYAGPQSVTLTAVDAGYIVYTLDGTTPSCAFSGTSLRYVGVFMIIPTDTLKAIGCSGNGGGVLTSVYTSANLSWSGLTNGQWTGLSNTQWTSMGN